MDNTQRRQYRLADSSGRRIPRGPPCTILAKEYAKHVGNPTVETVRIAEDGTLGPLLPATKKATREQENKSAIGSMRDPHLSNHKVPGWRAVGDRVRQCLDKVLKRHTGTWERVLEDCSNSDGFDEQLVEEARRAVEREFGGCETAAPVLCGCCRLLSRSLSHAHH